LNFTLPPPLATQLSPLIDTFVSTQLQFNGFLFGNNPASVPCLHEMGWFGLIAGMLPTGVTGDGTMGLHLAAVAREVEYILQCGWDDGQGVAQCGGGGPRGLLQRWWSAGFYNCPWGQLQDQQPHAIIAAHAVAVATGDAAWLARQLPALERLAAYMVSSGLGNFNATSNNNGTGLWSMPGSGVADGGRHTSNWMDVVEFGHLDGYVNAYAIWALQCLEDVYAFLGNKSAAAATASLIQAVQAAYNETLWDGAADQYVDWIDVDGVGRHYLYTDPAFIAIFTGTASPHAAVQVLSHVDSRLAAIAAAYNITLDALWATPCSLYPIVNSSDFATDIPVRFPTYESGGSFFHSTGLEVMARATVAGYTNNATAVGDVVTVFQRFMLQGIAPTRGWAQQLYWDTGQLVGVDPLNNALLTLWGFLRAGFGVHPTLSRGLVVTNPPAPQLDGATYTFAHLGRDVCVTVVGGRTVQC